MKILILGRFWSMCLTSLLMLAIGSSYAQSADIPIETFFDNPSMSMVKLSPDGQSLGMLVAMKNGRVQLVSMDVNTKEPKIIAGFTDADISQFHWVNSKRLVFTTTDKSLAIGDVRLYPGLFAINRDGSDSRTLVERGWSGEFTTGSKIKKRILPAESYLHSLDLRPESEHVFIAKPVWDGVYDLKAENLMLVNTNTGHAETFNRAGDTRKWLIDYEGVPRVNVTVEGNIRKVMYNDSQSGKWIVLEESINFQGGKFEPVDIGPDGSLYVVARKNDKDTSSLYRYDLQRRAIEDQPIVSIESYDFDGDLIFDRTSKTLLGVTYLNDAQATHWIDARMKALQGKLDALLPATINHISVARNGLSRYVVVNSYSDVQTMVYSVYDTQEHKLEVIGHSRPKVESNKMAMQDMVRYPARDGLSIPAYLTLPKASGKKNLPLIVLVHGGPYLRGSSWGWDAEVQFLASRGYAVIEPEFRGSTGFGFKHFRAGWKQWGLAMQDDLADAAKWAIAQGIADPKRICIAGASYGGYASLMGVAKNPELFQCAVNWIGVTDMKLMYESDWSNDSSAEWQNYGMPFLVGDPVQDAKQLKETSPVHLAASIKKPILLAYGGADRRVPIAHGEKFYEEVRKHNTQVEWIKYPNEGHGWMLEQTRVDFWGRVEKFLKAHIGQ